MRIVIVKLSALGDILQTLPILPRLLYTFPSCKIDWVVEKKFASVLQNHPAINKVITCDSKQLRAKPTLLEIKKLVRSLRRVTYDVLIDLQGNCKSGCINLLIRAVSKHGFSVGSTAEWPNILSTTFRYDVSSILSVREKNLVMLERIFHKSFTKAKEVSLFPLYSWEKKKVEDCLSRLSRDKWIVMICPFSKWPNKMISSAFLLEFLLSIRKHFPMQYLLIWQGYEQQRIVEQSICHLESYDLSLGDLSISIWYHLMLQSRLAITMDSSSLHLATLANLPTYAFFGPSKGNAYVPKEARYEYYQGSCPYQIHFKKRCPNLRSCRDGGCLQRLELKAVLQHFLQWAKKFSFDSE